MDPLVDVLMEDADIARDWGKKTSAFYGQDDANLDDKAHQSEAALLQKQRLELLEPDDFVLLGVPSLDKTIVPCVESSKKKKKKTKGASSDAATPSSAPAPATTKEKKKASKSKAAQVTKTTVDGAAESSEEDGDVSVTLPQDPKDDVHLTKEQMLALLKREHPELLFLINDLEAVHQSLKSLAPLIVRHSQLTESAKKWVKVQVKSRQQYLLNICFYLKLQASGASKATSGKFNVKIPQSHPILKRLLELRRLLKKYATWDKKTMLEIERVGKLPIMKSERSRLHPGLAPPESPKRNKLLLHERLAHLRNWDFDPGETSEDSDDFDDDVEAPQVADLTSSSNPFGSSTRRSPSMPSYAMIMRNQALGIGPTDPPPKLIKSTHTPDLNKRAMMYESSGSRGGAIRVPASMFAGLSGLGGASSSRHSFRDLFALPPRFSGSTSSSSSGPSGLYDDPSLSAYSSRYLKNPDILSRARAVKIQKMKKDKSTSADQQPEYKPRRKRLRPEETDPEEMKKKSKKDHKKDKKAEKRKEDTAAAATSSTQHEKSAQKKQLETDEEETVKKRLASKTILANRGLVRSRKKTAGNARVTNRAKYEKAKKKRKGAVLEMREGPADGTAYAGEESGLRTNIKKSKNLS